MGAKVDLGAVQEDPGGAQVDLGGAQLDSGGAQMDAGDAQLDPGGAQVDPGGAQMDFIEKWTSDSERMCHISAACPPDLASQNSSTDPADPVDPGKVAHRPRLAHKI